MPTVETFWVGTRKIGSKTVYQTRYIGADGKVLAMRTLREATSERSARKLSKELIPEVEAALAKKAVKALPADDPNNPVCLTYLRSLGQAVRCFDHSHQPPSKRPMP